MDGWIDCNDKLPEQIPSGCGKSSKDVIVLLSTGEEDVDFLINDRWEWHCKLDNVGGYPVKWKEK